MIRYGYVVDVHFRNHWDMVVRTEEVIDCSEDVMWVGVEGEFPVGWVEESPDVVEVE